MKKIHLIVDSAADMDAAFTENPLNHVLPLHIMFGNEEFLDGETISKSSFYEKLANSEKLPTTSQVAITDFEGLFQAITTNGDEAVVLTMSSKLSGTYQSANIAAENYRDSITVVDSLHVSIGEQILTRYAEELRNGGKSREEIAAALTAKRSKTYMIALLDTLEYLQKGGRISKTAAIAGGLLSIKPIVAVINGEITVLCKARGIKKGNQMFSEQIKKLGGIDFHMPFRLGHTGLDSTGLLKYIADSIDLWQHKADAEPITVAGSTVGTHTGPGAIAAAFFSK